MRIKYPRTLHLPWSPGRGDDDKVLSEGQVEEKLDGENTPIYQDGTCHAAFEAR